MAPHGAAFRIRLEDAGAYGILQSTTRVDERVERLFGARARQPLTIAPPGTAGPAQRAKRMGRAVRNRWPTLGVVSLYENAAAAARPQPARRPARTVTDRTA